MSVVELLDTFFTYGRSRSYYFGGCYVDEVVENTWYFCGRPLAAYEPPRLHILFPLLAYSCRHRLNLIINEWRKITGVNVEMNVWRCYDHTLLDIFNEERNKHYIAKYIVLVPKNGGVVVERDGREDREVIPDFYTQVFLSPRIYIAKYGVLRIAYGDHKLFYKKIKGRFYHEVTLEEVKTELTRIREKLGRKGKKHADLIMKASSVEELRTLFSPAD